MTAVLDLPEYTGEPYEVLLRLKTVGGTIAMSVRSEESRHAFERAALMGDLGRVEVISIRKLILLEI